MPKLFLHGPKTWKVMRPFEKSSAGLGWETVHNWECSFVHRKQGPFFSENVDDMNMSGRKQNLSPLWKRLMNLVILGKPISFLDHAYLGCPGWEKSHSKTVA